MVVSNTKMAGIPYLILLALFQLLSRTITQKEADILDLIQSMSSSLAVA